MHSELNQISTLQTLIDFDEEVSSTEIGGYDYQIEKIDEYMSDHSSYHSRYYIVDSNIIYIKSSGHPSSIDIKNASDILENHHIDRKLNDLEFIWDLRDVGKINIKTRKEVIKCNDKLSRYWKNRYLVISPKNYALLRIFKINHQNKVENLHLVDTVEKAFKHIINNNPLFKDDIAFSLDETLPDLADLKGKSKEELIEMIIAYKNSQEKTTKTVMEAVGQMSRFGKFKKVIVDIDKNDPNFEILNAISLLQEDVSEIIKDYKELNQNLELNVAERIVDFIDKETNLRAILDNSDRVTWLMNTRYELIDFNIAFSNEIDRRYNKTPKINQSVLDVIDSEEEREIWKIRFESALHGKPGIYLDQDNFDSKEQVLEIKTFPIKDFGKIKGVSVSIEDITELKKSQLKLIDKNNDLQKVNNELDSFVYRVSHDLRAPLTSILGLISLMKMEKNNDTIGEYIDLQEKSIHKLDLFIKEIMNLSRNSRLGITVGKIEFDELINDIFEGEHYTRNAEKVKRICIVEEGFSFYTDRQRLSIILNNLISNGLKYANPSQEEPKVKVEVYSENNDCIIRVSDNGIGISEEYLPKIFAMFFRATEDSSGSGLGLYIVKETVEKLNGKITVRSTMRKGTTFKVVLPNLKDRYHAASKMKD